MPEFGLAGQEKLKAARVLVIGAGGLGCPVMQYLVAAGVGTIAVMDDDRVETSNLHRQILYGQEDVGYGKAETAVRKLSALNPFVALTAINKRISEENALQYVSAYDLVIDGSDNFPTRYVVNDACVAAGKPLIFGSILRFEGQVSVFNYQNGPTYRCLFPEAEDGDNCEVAGVLGALPGIIGSYMATEAVKVICGIGNVLSGKLLVINTLTNSQNIFTFERTVPIKAETKPIVEKQQTIGPPRMPLEELEARLETDRDDLYLVDVREYIEFEADGIGGLNIPLSEVPDFLGTFPGDQDVVFFCNTGKRSLAAAKLVAEAGHTGKLFWARND